MNQKIAQIFRALADDTRLRVLYFLTKSDELCVCDFIDLLAISQSKASRHLRYLLRAGFLQDRREAVWVYYRLANPMGREQAQVLTVVQKLVTAAEEVQLSKQLEDRLKRKVCSAPPAGGGVQDKSRKKRKRI